MVIFSCYVILSHLPGLRLDIPFSADRTCNTDTLKFKVYYLFWSSFSFLTVLHSTRQNIFHPPNTYPNLHHVSYHPETPQMQRKAPRYYPPRLPSADRPGNTSNRVQGLLIRHFIYSFPLLNPPRCSSWHDAFSSAKRLHGSTFLIVGWFTFDLRLGMWPVFLYCLVLLNSYPLDTWHYLLFH